MATAGTQIEISRLNAINSVVSSMQKADTDSRGPANVLTLAVGGLRYAYAMAQRVVIVVDVHDPAPTISTRSTTV